MQTLCTMSQGVLAASDLWDAGGLSRWVLVALRPHTRSGPFRPHLGAVARGCQEAGVWEG